MPKLWIIAKHEYLKITRKRSFVLGTLAMPLFFIVITAFAIIMVLASEDQRPLGYVDLAGVLTTVTKLPPEKDGPQPVELQAFADEVSSQGRTGRQANSSVLRAARRLPHQSQSAVDLLGQKSFQLDAAPL